MKPYSCRCLTILLVICAIGLCAGAGVAEESPFPIVGCDGFHDALEFFYTKHAELIGHPVLIEGYLYCGTAPSLERDSYYYVYHWGESCCDDGLDREGIEVVWMSEEGTYPEPESYVRAVGILSIYQDHGMQLMRLELLRLDSIADACAEQ